MASRSMRVLVRGEAMPVVMEVDGLPFTRASYKGAPLVARWQDGGTACIVDRGGQPVLEMDLATPGPNDDPRALAIDARVIACLMEDARERGLIR